MRRGLLALLLIVHGLLHASVGVWAATGHWLVAVNTLWSVAIVGYVAAGFALLRVPVLRKHWKGTLLVATGASVLLLVVYGGLVGLAGVPVGLALAFLSFDVMQVRIDTDVDAAEHSRGDAPPGRGWRRLGWTAAVTLLAYVATVVAVRPAYLRWGTTTAERLATLPGDDLAVNARYRVDHGITIRAPADSVWPWLVQLGQDRGGFYSHSRLERMAGARITNAGRIHEEWQTLSIGDTVRATQADYFGGRFGTLGWEVIGLEPGRALILRNWGAFVLQPIDSTTTRFFVRTRGKGGSSALGLMLGPLNVFVFEPAHFIMQRGMMRGIRDRAEGKLPGAT